MHSDPDSQHRSLSPRPFRVGPTSLLQMSLSTVIALIVFTVSLTAIYLKMPSADQIAKIDAELQKQISVNKTNIDRMSTQVGFLVRIEVAAAAGDPMQRQVIRKAAREAQSQAVADAQQPLQPASPNPLDGIRLE